MSFVNKGIKMAGLLHLPPICSAVSDRYGAWWSSLYMDAPMFLVKADVSMTITIRRLRLWICGNLVGGTRGPHYGQYS
jgi:hypothetical protein